MENIVFEHQYTVEGYITFTVKVMSGDFSGTSNFCIAEILLNDAILALTEMYDNLEGTCQIKDYDSDDFILFELLRHGHIKISGQVGGSHNDQFLKYQFTTDQTVLNIIISSFKGMIVS